jgi:hypothetical protein
MSGALKFLGFGTNAQAGLAPFQGVQVQTSAATQVINIVYGQTRISTNLIWYGDFSTHNGGGGKGGSSGKGGTTTFSASVMMGLCEGPIETVIAAWVNSSYETIAKIGMTAFNGTATQAPWSYMTANHAAQARS